MDSPELREFIVTRQGLDPQIWPPTSWNLTNLVLAGIYFNPDLDRARARWAVARAARTTASERPNPTLTVSPAYNASSGVPTPWLVTAALDLPIETAGKRGYRMAEAGHLSEAARWNIASVAWAVRSRIRQVLLELATAEETGRLLREQQAVQEENLKILENQFRLGAISAFDLTQARIAANSTLLALRDAERQRIEGRIQLADAIGVPAAALASVPLSFAEVESLSEEIPSGRVLRQSLLRRTDLLAALAEYDASQSALQLEIARQYPDIHLGPGYEFDQGDSKWSFGPALTLPLLSRNRGAIAEAKARRDEAATVVLTLQAHALAELERTLAGYRSSLLKSADAESLRLNLLKQENSAKAMLAAGEISKAELAAIRLQLSAAALARLDALTKSRQAYGALEDAMQGTLDVASAAWENAPRSASHRSESSSP